MATTMNDQSFLQGKIIGISISESPDLAERGFGKMHLQDAMVEFARYFLASGATLAYGGDLREGGFTEILFDLVQTHNKSGKPPYERIVNYLAWPIHLRLSTAHKAELRGVADFRPLDPPAYLNVDKNQFIAPVLTGDRYIWAHSLTHMREDMNRATDARLLMGGQVIGYKGKYPGLVEEAYLAMRDEKPLFLIGGMGGCTCLVIEALLGKKPEMLGESVQTAGNDEYKELVEYYNSHLETVPEENRDPVDYKGLVEFFNKKGVKGLNNGLNENDNKRLFETIHIPEMISLVLKGLEVLGKSE